MIHSSRRILPIVALYALLACGCKSSDQSSANQGATLAPQFDLGWPRTFEKNGQQVIFFQPQVLDWANQQQIRFRAAVAVSRSGDKEPVYGVINASAETLIDLEPRTAYLYNLQLDIAFPSMDENQARALQAIVQDALPSLAYMPISIDHIIANLKSAKVKRAAVVVNLNPPPIYYFDSPSILVIFNGAPQFKPIEGTELNFAVNTNWDLLQDRKTSRYYLLNGDSWLTASDLLKGVWTPATNLPDDFSKLPNDQNWDAVRKHIPGKPSANAPLVVTSTQPAEMIVTQGQPNLVPIPGTTLQYVSNPKMPLFYNTADGAYYYLVAGRWFSTRNLHSDSWTAASAQLPGEFAKIPRYSPMGYVLASVPGTPEAQDAIVIASIPHEASININDAKVAVIYDGDPQFVPIEGTLMTYAVNTTYQDISVNGNITVVTKAYGLSPRHRLDLGSYAHRCPASSTQFPPLAPPTTAPMFRSIASHPLRSSSATPPGMTEHTLPPPALSCTAPE
jgi:hypothetical protein